MTFLSDDLLSWGGCDEFVIDGPTLEVAVRKYG